MIGWLAGLFVSACLVVLCVVGVCVAFWLLWLLVVRLVEIASAR